MPLNPTHPSPQLCANIGGHGPSFRARKVSQALEMTSVSEWSQVRRRATQGLALSDHKCSREEGAQRLCSYFSGPREGVGFLVGRDQVYSALCFWQMFGKCEWKGVRMM